MKLTDPVVFPEWLKRAFPPTTAIVLLLCALDFLNWQANVLPTLRVGGLMWDGGTDRCFDNVEALMPIAHVLRWVLCPPVGAYLPDGAAMHLRADFTKLCLFGGVAATFLAARAIAGWWSAGVAAAFVATSPLLFSLDYQMSPAAVGVLAGSVSCWLVAEAFGRPDRGTRRLWTIAWFMSAALAIGLHVEAAWLVAGQAIYALVQHRAIRASDRSPTPVSIGVAAVAGLAVLGAFAPAGSMAAAIARADVRGATAGIFAFSYPDQWMAQPHFATCLSVIALLVLVGGALAAPKTAIPYLVCSLFVQALVASMMSVDTAVKVSSLAYAVPVIALSMGAIAEVAVKREPFMLAFVIPAFAIAAQYAAFDRLSMIPYQTLDFDSATAAPVPAFQPSELVRTFHDRHHADQVTVYSSLDGLVHHDQTFDVPPTDAAVVTAIEPYRVQRSLSVAYAVTARDGSWRGYMARDTIWSDPAPRSIISQPFSKVRLYDRTDVPYRGNAYARLEPVGTRFEVLDVNQVAYQPDLHVRVADGPDAGREGWVYAQILLLGPAAELNRSGR